MRFIEQRDEEELEAMLAEMKTRHSQYRLKGGLALQALDRLALVLQHRSGQPYKLRALLYSLYNGKPASLIEVLGLDAEIRADLALVVEGFGFEDAKVKCFYDAMKAAITKAGQWEWFIAEHENNDSLRNHLESCGYTVTPQKL